ncbi:MAG: helix-turn-helix domain-containing protein [Ktedonobacteraceae bacterium]|nr:helix-turn-helix domain-containing protein [Ktedonobacteraceae bacterium]
MQKEMASYHHLLKAFRLQHNWTQAQVAEKIGTTNLNVSRWERGVMLPNLYFRQRLCELFEVSASELGFVSDEESLAVETRPYDHTPAFGETGSTPSVWQIPYQRNPFFSGREEILRRLHTLLSRQTGSIAVQPYALCGMAGIGKTQVALEYAYRYGQHYSAVLWVQADTEETVHASLASIVQQLQLMDEEGTDRNIVDTVLHWLGERQDWLLIVDNIEDVECIRPFLPKIGGGALLVTTRLQAPGSMAQSIEVPQMTLEEGAEFLLRRTRLVEPQSAAGEDASTPSPTDYAEACMLVEMMGGLPQALNQAGAYIEETLCSLSDFLHLFQAYLLRLLSERDTHSDYPYSVVQAFMHALEWVQQSNPAAVELLMMWPLLEADSLPERLLIDRAVRLRPQLAPLMDDPLRFNTLLRSLLARSLIRRDRQSKMITIHPLLQTVLRECSAMRCEVET